METHNDILIGISSCLLGNKVRYDGQHKLSVYLRDELGAHVRFYPVCPEAECGMSTPREPANLNASATGPRFVTVNTSRDFTPQLQNWIDGKIVGLKNLPLCGFVLKSNSPSCGLKTVKLYQNGREIGKGSGLFAAAVLKHFPGLPVEDELMMADTDNRSLFLQKAFEFQRLKFS